MFVNIYGYLLLRKQKKPIYMHQKKEHSLNFPEHFKVRKKMCHLVLLPYTILWLKKEKKSGNAGWVEKYFPLHFNLPSILNHFGKKLDVFYMSCYQLIIISAYDLYIFNTKNVSAITGELFFSPLLPWGMCQRKENLLKWRRIFYVMNIFQLLLL